MSTPFLWLQVVNFVPPEAQAHKVVYFGGKNMNYSMHHSSKLCEFS